MQATKADNALERELLDSQESLDSFSVGGTDFRLRPQMTSALRVLLGQNMAMICVAAQDSARLAHFEPFRRASAGFQLRHLAYFPPFWKPVGLSGSLTGWHLRTCRRRGWFGRAQGHQNHVLLATDLDHAFFKRGNIRKAFDHPYQQTAPQLDMGHLATAKLHRDFDLVAESQKLANVAKLDLQIVAIYGRAHLDFFELGSSAAFASFSLSPLLLVKQLAVVNDFAHRWVSLGGNLDQIQSYLFGLTPCLLDRNDANLLAVEVDQSNFAGADCVVDAQIRPFVNKPHPLFHAVATHWRTLSLCLLLFLFPALAVSVSTGFARPTSKGKRFAACQSDCFHLTTTK